MVIRIFIILWYTDRAINPKNVLNPKNVMRLVSISPNHLHFLMALYMNLPSKYQVKLTSFPWMTKAETSTGLFLTILFGIQSIKKPSSPGMTSNVNVVQIELKRFSIKNKAVKLATSVYLSHNWINHYFLTNRFLSYSIDY